MTAKQLEQETGCKIMVRGKGSMRDKKKVRIINYVCYLRISSFNLNQFIDGWKILLTLDRQRNVDLSTYTHLYVSHTP